MSDLDIHPGMPEEKQRQKIAAATDREVFKFARVWKLFAAEIESGREEFYSLDLLHETPNMKTGLRENIISMQFSDEARFQNTPLLIIDADADQQILNRFYAGIEVEKIDAEIGGSVNIRQVADRTGSMTAFRNQANQDRAFHAALNISDFCEDQFRDDPTARPLVVVQKQVRDAWLEAGKLESAPFAIEHFGNLRGKDGWRNTCALTIFGRIEPAPGELESMAKSLWFQQPATFEFLPRDEQGRVPALPKTAAQLTDRTGASTEVMTGYHPDARINSILLQVREAELHQAIARARPFFRDLDSVCYVTVATNVPLAVRPHQIITWNELIPNRFEILARKGFLPLESHDVSAIYPGFFNSAFSVRKYIERHAINFGEFDKKSNMYKIQYILGNKRTRSKAYTKISLFDLKYLNSITLRVQSIDPRIHDVEEPIFNKEYDEEIAKLISEGKLRNKLTANIIDWEDRRFNQNTIIIRNSTTHGMPQRGDIILMRRNGKIKAYYPIK